MIDRRTPALALAGLLALGSLGVIAGCGGSSSKAADTTTTTEVVSSSTTKAPSGSSTTAGGSSSTSSSPKVTYISCINNVLTVKLDPGTGATSITSAKVSRSNGTATPPETTMTKGADGNWSGAIPSGSSKTVTVSVKNDLGKSYSRSSEMPGTWDNMTTQNCS